MTQYINPEDQPEESVPTITPFELPCGRVIMIDSRLDPTLREWDWRYDNELALVIREQDGKQIRFYDELVRMNRGQGDHYGFPVLDRTALRRLFGHLPAYKKLVERMSAQRTVADEEGFNIPPATDYLALALSYALTKYYIWTECSTRITFVPDPDNLTPGRLEVQNNLGSRTRYATLGEWATHEYIGEWRSDEESATGLVPISIADIVERGMFIAWRMAFQDANRREARVEDAEEALVIAKKPIQVVASYAMQVVRHYPL